MILSFASIAMVTGLVGGAFAGYKLGRALVLKVLRQGSHIVWAGSAAGGLIMLWPALYVAIAVGGTLGGGWGESIFEPLGLGKIGVPVGLTLGIGLVLTVCLAIGVLVGGWIGKGIEHVFRIMATKR